MRRALRPVLIVVAIAAAYLLFWPVPIDPVVFRPPANPGLTGPFAPNETLRAADHRPANIGPAPEDITKGPDGFFYTGLQDGRIVRFREDAPGVETFVNTGGRPLGMQFDAGGNLIVADAFRGLLSVSPDRRIRVLVDQVEGERLLFPNDLDIAKDGTIWFSDSSRRFDQLHYMLDFLEARGTGRLLTYEPGTGRTTVRLRELMFANGVAVAPDAAYVLVNETMAARVTRLWLTGPDAGRSETFLTLPGYPDNLSLSKDGLIWIAMPNRRDPALERLWGSPFIRKFLLRLPSALRKRAIGPPYSWVVAADTHGNLVHNLQDSRGGCGTVTSANEFDGTLYLGSISTTFVSRYKLR